jgi:hypothetical protein
MSLHSASRLFLALQSQSAWVSLPSYQDFQLTHCNEYAKEMIRDGNGAPEHVCQRRKILYMSHR